MSIKIRASFTTRSFFQASSRSSDCIGDCGACSRAIGERYIHRLESQLDHFIVLPSGEELSKYHAIQPQYSRKPDNDAYVAATTIIEVLGGDRLLSIDLRDLFSFG